MNAQIGSLPPREAVLVEGVWRIAHAFNTSLPGWLVVVPTRHVERLDELSADEVTPLGGLLRGATAALRAVVGCEKTYVMLFAEATGFAHLHIHVVPKMSWFTDEHRGPGVFAFSARPESEWIPESERDALAGALTDHLS